MAKKSKTPWQLGQMTQAALRDYRARQREARDAEALHQAALREGLGQEAPAHPQGKPEGASGGRLPAAARIGWGLTIALLTGATLWAYWPTLTWMENQWRHEPDYSHGYVVLPLALLLVYLRRGSFPGAGNGVGWGGMGLLLLAIVGRVASRFAYMDFLDGWTLVPWVAGLVWLTAGRRAMWWSLPAIVFLVMLTPMPYRAESLLSFKLQGIATAAGVIALRTLGFAAIADGNTIWLGEQQLMVEEACSGLRIFMGMVAMGFFFAVLSNRSWLDRVIIVACCFPIAILVNILRVTGTGLAYQWFSPRWAHQAHDLLGILMVVVGALMLFGVKHFWEQLYRPLEMPMLQRRLASQ